MRPVGLAVVVLLMLASGIVEAQPAPTPRIGFLGAGNADAESRQVAAFRQGLRDLGWIEFRDYVEDGGLMSYGPCIIEMFRGLASYVDRILKGAKATCRSPGRRPSSSRSISRPQERSA